MSSKPPTPALAPPSTSCPQVGVICYLKQLLDTGFFHADPHPGNLIRTPDGRLAILDFGLVTIVDDNIKVGCAPLPPGCSCLLP